LELNSRHPYEHNDTLTKINHSLSGIETGCES
jgi:hypothetical protein